MATRDVKNVEKDYLTCALCLDNYKEPKILPCQHSFCRACLEAHIRESGVRGNQFKCPVDRKLIYVDNQNLSAGELARSFPDSLFLEDLSNLVEDHEANPLFRAQNKCRKHDNKPNEFVCITCRQIMCGHCAVLEHNPIGCHTTTINQAAADLNQNLAEIKTKLEAQLRSVNLLRKGGIGENRWASAANLAKNVIDTENAFQECYKHILETVKTIKRLPVKVIQDRRKLEKDIRDATATLNAVRDAEAPQEALTRCFSIQTQIEHFEKSLQQLRKERDNLKNVEPIVQSLRGLLDMMLDFNVRTKACH